MMGSTSDTSGEVKTAVSGKYLAQALKACGGMVELKASSPNSPMMFSVDGYRLLVMPMLTEDTVKRTTEQAVAVAEAEEVAEQAEADEDEGVELPPDEVKEPVYAKA